MTIEAMGTVAALIASIFAAIFSYLSWRSDGKRRLAEMRLKWLEELRVEITELSYLSADKERFRNNVAKAEQLNYSLAVRLNLEEKDNREIINTTAQIVKAQTLGDYEEIRKANTEFLVLGKALLKREWEKIKSELSN